MENDTTIQQRIQSLPKYHPTKEYRDELEENVILKILQDLENYAITENAVLIKIDGIRAEFENSWFLARKSGTEQVLSYRIEGKTLQARDSLKNKVMQIINQP